MSVVGFDFGNHKCVVAVARRRGIDVLQNEVGHRSTPSVVAFAGPQRFIGGEAQAQQMKNAANTITNLKRLFGLPFASPELPREQSFINYRTLAGRNGLSAVEVSYDDKKEVFQPEQITAALLQKLRGVAESGLDGQKVTDCVISCPHWWTDVHRRQLLDAANIAGLNVLRLMNESTAVGLNYGILRPLPKDATQKVMFVDVGHSQTNASVISFTEGKLVVNAVESDRQLGGRDFDDLLVNHFSKYILEKYKMDVTKETKAMLKLRKECERVKLNLSANQKVPFNVEYIMNDRDVSGMIERSEFDSLATASLLPRLVSLITSVLTKANLKKEELHSIEVVGGTHRIPIVQKYLSEFLGKDISKTCDADESVARGCALMCAMISPSFKVRDFDVQDVSMYPIAFEWGPVPAKLPPTDNMIPEDSTPLFSSNNAIPSVKLISFNDRTDPFQLVARYTNPDLLPVATNPVIGRYIVSGMPTKDQDGNVRAPKIKVRVKLTQHGTLHVTNAQIIEEVKEEVKAAPLADSKTAEDVPMADGAAAGAGAAGDKAPDASPPPAAEPSCAGGDKDKMDTAEAGTEPSKETKDAAATKVSTKVVKKDIKVDSYTHGGLDATALQQFFEREAAMANQDRVIFETNEARNALESYILEMRNKLSGELQPFVKDSDRESFEKQLTAAEDWLYGEGSEAQKSEYKSKLADQKKSGDPIQSRHFEAENRPYAVEQLKTSLNQYAEWTNTKDEKYAHIGADDRQKVTEIVQKASDWLDASLSTIDKAPKFDNPAIVIKQIQDKKAEVERAANPIINKPKPKPEPKPEAKKEEAKAADAAAGAAGAGAADGSEMKTDSTASKTGDAAGAAGSGATASGAESTQPPSAGMDTSS